MTDYKLNSQDVNLIPFTDDEWQIYIDSVKEGVWPTVIYRMEKSLKYDYPECDIMEMMDLLEESANQGFDSFKIYDRDYDALAVKGTGVFEDEERVIYDVVVKKMREFERSGLFQTYKRHQEGAELAKQAMMNEREARN